LADFGGTLQTGGMYTSSKRLEFGDDLNYDANRGLFNGILSLWDTGNCKNVARSAALAMVCSLPNAFGIICEFAIFSHLFMQCVRLLLCIRKV